jgi:hypothetical protein
MKSLTTKLMIAAAALVAASAASAQVLKADIPFAFQAGGKVLEAGTYRLDLHGPSGMLLIENTHHGAAAVMAMPTSHIQGNDESAKLVFQCTHGSCTLVQAWAGYNASGLQFNAPKVDRREQASLTVVRLYSAAAE